MKRLTTRATADILGISPETVRQYAVTGLLAGITYNGRRGRGQRFYFDVDEVEAFAKGGAFAARAFREQQATGAIVKRRGRKRIYC